LSGAREDLAVLGRFADVLDGLGVPYAVGGSLASGAWGEPRSTHDVDVAVDLPLETVPALVAALQTDFFVDETSVREAAERRSSFNAIHKRLYLKVDVFVAGDGELDRRGDPAEPLCDLIVLHCLANLDCQPVNTVSQMSDLIQQQIAQRHNRRR
jgi:hypothetical protein